METKLFTIRDYTGNRTYIDLTLTPLIKTILLGEDFGDQTLEVVLVDGTSQYIHAGFQDYTGSPVVVVYEDGVFYEKPSELYKIKINL